MSDWVTLLQRHAAALPPGPTPESLEADCEAAFAALADERRAADVSAHPSYAVIPPFFRGRASSEDGGTDFARLLNRAAKMNRLQARETQMVDGDDLEALERALAAVVARASASDEPPSPDSPGAPRPEPPRMLGYDEYRSLRDSRALAPKLRHRLTARLFLRLPRDPRGRVRCEDLLHHIYTTTITAQTRNFLERFDSHGEDALSEADLERYIRDRIPSMPTLRDMEEDFHKYYVFTAARRFLFFLDVRHTGRIPIRTLCVSHITQEFLEMGCDDADDKNGTGGGAGGGGGGGGGAHTALDMPSLLSSPASPMPLPANAAGALPPSPRSDQSDNWFSVDNVRRVYHEYLELDLDQNGMLSKAELLNYGQRESDPKRYFQLTPAFVDRVFEEIVTWRMTQGSTEGEMDYKTFLDFVLAVENKRTHESLAYYWRVLDMNEKGYLTAFELNYFFRDIVSLMAAQDIGPPAAFDDVLSEIFDMVRPADPSKITFDDLCKCGHGHTIVSMITDVHGFWLYDNRESLV